MNRLFWILPLILAISCSKGKKIEVTGTVLNANQEMIYLDEQGLASIRPADSASIKMDGSFKLKDRIEQPTFYNLHLGNQKIIPLLLNPGDVAQVQSDADGFSSGYSISGSYESVQIQDLNLTLSRTIRSIDSLQKLLGNNPEIDDEFMAMINESYQEVIDAQRKKNVKFVLDNRDNMVAIYALYQRIGEDFVLNRNRDIQMLKITAQILDTIYPESEHVKALKRNAAQLEQDLYSEKIRNLITNSESTTPEIRLPDPFGDTISLQSLKGKVVLLSFWASWNEESVADNIPLKDIYKAYHSSGFEIYQVSFDNEFQPWMRAIQYDELPWINVSELSYPESIVGSLYNVTELPTTYLIDREGAILSRNPTLNELYSVLPGLLN